MYTEIKTKNNDIKLLIADFVELTQKSFPNALVSIYVMGSLARGGFSESASDIDLGIIYDKPSHNTEEIFSNIKEELKQKYNLIKNNISIFYGSISEINNKKGSFRYPPFDRLDLIKHALLISGNEVRQKLIEPNKEELLIATANFALGYLATEIRIRECKNPMLIIDKGLTYLTKTILFPVRFIYFEKTDSISGNDVSVNYYLNHFETNEKELVRYGFGLRNNKEISTEAIELLKKYLIPLYLRFIDIYIPVLSKYNKQDLVNEFQQWRKKLITVE